MLIIMRTILFGLFLCLALKFKFATDAYSKTTKLIQGLFILMPSAISLQHLAYAILDVFMVIDGTIFQTYKIVINITCNLVLYFALRLLHKTLITEA